VDVLNPGDQSPLSPAAMDSTPLSLPSCPQPFIELTFLSDQSVPIVDLLTPPVSYPSIDGEPFVAKLSNAKVLTKNGSPKTTMEVTLKLASVTLQFTTYHQIESRIVKS